MKGVDDELTENEAGGLVSDEERDAGWGEDEGYEWEP